MKGKSGVPLIAVSHCDMEAIEELYIILAWLKLTDTCHIHPLPNKNFSTFV